MATSGSVDYIANRDEIITEALELLGMLEAGESPSANDLTTCGRTLNMMVKGLMAEGVQLWKVSEAELTLVASQSSYTLGAGGDLVIDKPLRILEARRRDSDNIDTPLFSLSRDEYMTLSNKTTTGLPTQYYFQPGRLTSSFTVWPVPDSDVASSDTVMISYYSPIEDFDSASDDPDFPTEWLESLSHMLALRVAPKYEVSINSIPSIVQLAAIGKETILSWGQEHESVYFGVEFQ